MTEIEKLIHSMDILLEHRNTTFKLVHGIHNIDIYKLKKELGYE